jgi:hypothetical protein
MPSPAAVALGPRLAAILCFDKPLTSNNRKYVRGAPASKSGVSGYSFVAADKVLLAIKAGRPSQRRSLGIWPMQRFEYPPSGIRDRDAAKLDCLLARLNGFTLNCREPATKEAA